MIVLKDEQVPQQVTGISELPGSSAKIIIENLNFYYGTKQVLFHVSLAMRERSITALIGPSGCGKSTFLRTLNRMNDMIGGTRVDGGILLDGEDIYHSEIDVVALRRRVGMVFQTPTPFPMSIFDNVAYGARINGLARGAALTSLVEETIRQAALWDEVKDHLHQPAASLSGGQQQRLCIARMLAMQPEVLLMDEPCSALDPISTASIEELMLQLKQQYTIIIVTHNMQQAARVSDDTGFFLNGELVEFASSTRMFTDPCDKRTEEYITGRFG